MPNENDTEASRRDALNAYESLFGDAEPSADDAVAKAQDAESETEQDSQGSEVAGEQAGVDQGRADESDQDSQGSQVAEDQTAEGEARPTEDLKVVVSIKDGRATIGVQQPSSDPHIESVDAPELSGLAGDLLAVVARAKARWESAPKHPAHTRPAASTPRRPRREQGSGQTTGTEGQAGQAQQAALKLF